MLVNTTVIHEIISNGPWVGVNLNQGSNNYKHYEWAGSNLGSRKIHDKLSGTTFSKSWGDLGVNIEKFTIQSVE